MRSHAWAGCPAQLTVFHLVVDTSHVVTMWLTTEKSDGIDQVVGHVLIFFGGWYSES